MVGRGPQVGTPASEAPADTRAGHGDPDGRDRPGVAHIAVTPSDVTVAALLLSITFFAFATSGVTFIKLFGLGLGLAVLVDAFVVRATLVPALVKLAGDRNWWAPAPLRRFHNRFGISESAPEEPTPEPATVATGV